MSALDNSLRLLAETHDLLSVCVTRHTDSHTAVTLQWADDTDDLGRGCVIGSGKTANEALKNALAAMHEQRVEALAGELVA